MVVSYDGNPPIGTYPYREWYIPNSKGEYIESLALGNEAGELLLAAGSEEGHLAIWHFDSGRVLSVRAHAHVGRINALSFGNFLGHKALASGGADGTVRLWTMGLAELLRLDLGQSIRTLAPTGIERLAVGGEAGLAAFQFPQRDRRSSLDRL
jgi:WD40 repeat protein